MTAKNEPIPLTIDRIRLHENGLHLLDTDGTVYAIDAQCAAYLLNWLCRHVVPINAMARAQAERENQELRGLFS